MGRIWPQSRIPEVTSNVDRSSDRVPSALRNGRVEMGCAEDGEDATFAYSAILCLAAFWSKVALYSAHLAAMFRSDSSGSPRFNPRYRSWSVFHNPCLLSEPFHASTISLQLCRRASQWGSTSSSAISVSASGMGFPRTQVSQARTSL
jgi:hypothetical protein